FLERRDKKKQQLATDQLLNAIFMVTRERNFVGNEKKNLQERLIAALDSSMEEPRRK
ncbi:AAA family ATPase, partial [filamentous cyanobacterium CCP1]